MPASKSLARVKREGLGDDGLLVRALAGAGATTGAGASRTGGPSSRSRSRGGPGYPSQRSPSTLSHHSFAGTHSDGYSSPVRSRSRDARHAGVGTGSEKERLSSEREQDIDRLLERDGSPHGSADGAGGEFEAEAELADAMGQLSVNEEAQVRYHGKASGLHLLVMGDMGKKLSSRNGRNEGGLWLVFAPFLSLCSTLLSFLSGLMRIFLCRRFPKARVWPQVPYDVTTNEADASLDFCVRLPDPAVQEHLLELYFAYVHPYLPIVHKQQFWKDFSEG